MSFVRTLLGDIEPTELGVTYCHEHILCSPPYWKERNNHDLILDDVQKSTLEVLDFKELGGDSIVDATAVDYGRDVQSMKKISLDTGINIIGTAGFNKSFLWKAKIPKHIGAIVGDYKTYVEWIDESSIEELAEFVIKEIEEGLEGTQVRAGQVKFGTGYNRISPLEIKTIRAVAQAHHVTKAPIHTHTEGGTMALEQIQFLKEENINLEFVSFGHMDRNPDPFYHEKIADTGAYLSFDGIGKVKYYPENIRIDCILNLVGKGYEDQILISGDTARKSYFKHYDYGLGFEYILKNWIPRFITEANEKGFDGEELIKKFFVENPMNYLTFKK